MITLQRLKELVSYDPETGIFTRKESSTNRVKTGSEVGWLDVSTGYVRIMLDRKTYRAHRLAWYYMTGDDVQFIDHINRDRSDNRFSNLRPCTKSENGMNRCSQRNSTSGHVGVSFDKETGKWVAYIYAGNRQIKLGRFSEKEEAVRARLDAELSQHGKFAASHANGGSISKPMVQK